MQLVHLFYTFLKYISKASLIVAFEYDWCRNQCEKFEHSSFILQSWELHIKPIKESDEGVYECQLSAHPPASIFVHLSVVGK